jgi:hypothetical protein
MSRIDAGIAISSAIQRFLVSFADGIPCGSSFGGSVTPHLGQTSVVYSTPHVLQYFIRP